MAEQVCRDGLTPIASYIAQEMNTNALSETKTKIAARFASKTTGSRYWHTRDDFKYFYDIWSNIHYGYVGRASGFSASMLLDGAGLEQTLFSEGGETELFVQFMLDDKQVNWHGPKFPKETGYRIAVVVDGAGNVTERHCILPCWAP